jgi:hypothetical protein
MGDRVDLGGGAAEGIQHGEDGGGDVADVDHALVDASGGGQLDQSGELDATGAETSCGAGDAACADVTAGMADASPPCTERVIMNASGACVSDMKMQFSAQQECARLMETLSAFSPDDNGCAPYWSSSARYSCCPSAPPAVPPPSAAMCTGLMVATPGGGCASDMTLQIQAMLMCTMVMNMNMNFLKSFSPDDACGPGMSRSAAANCCTN